MELKERRKLAGYSTQEQLAEKIGVSIATIRAYEQNSKNKNSRNINKAELENLIDLSNALDCKISDILTDPKLIEKCKTAKL